MQKKSFLHLFLLFFSVSYTQGATITVTTTANWSTLGITAADDVVIGGNNNTVTVDISTATCNSLNFQAPSNKEGHLDFNNGSQLTVTNAVNIPNDGNSPFSITMTNGGKLICNSLTVASGASYTFTPGTGTIELTNTNTIPAGYSTFNNLNILGQTTLSGSVVVNGVLNQINGNIILGANNLTVNGIHNAGTFSVSGTGTYTLGTTASLVTAATTGISGNITTSGTKIYPSTANYTFNSSTNLTITGLANTTPTANTVNNLTISGVGVKTLNANVTVTNALTIAPGGKFTLSTGRSFTAGSFIIQSDITGTGSFINNGTIANYTATVQRYLGLGPAPANLPRSWYITPPVSSVATSGFSRIQSWVETTGSWSTSVANATITAGKGYLTDFGTSPGTASFAGTLNNGNVTVTLTRTTGQTKEGYNLIGNPYPSYLSWSAVAAANTANLETGTMYYRTKTGAGSANYVFKTVSAAGIPEDGTVSNNIPPMQAFWVRKKVGGGNLSLNNTMRLHKLVTTNLLKAPAAKNEDTQLLRLTVSNGLTEDNTVIFFNSIASNDFDYYDSPKMSNENPAIPEIFTMAGGENLVINGLNNVIDNPIVALGFTPGQVNTFSIKLTELTNFEAGTLIYLHDNVTGTDTELTEGTPYTFTSDATPTSTRFTILFKTPSVIANNENVELISKFSARYSEGKVIVNYTNKLNERSTMAVYNTMGQLLISKPMTSNYTALDMSLSKGIYLVAVQNAGVSSTQKIIVQ